NQHRLSQELTYDIRLACTDCAPDTDFARSLEHSGEHDVHDADTAHQQRNARDTDHDNAEDHLRLLALFQQAGGNHDSQIPRILMRGAQDSAHHVGGLDGIDILADLHINAVDLILQVAGVVFEAPHYGVERRQDDVVAAVGLHSFYVGIG